MWYLGIGIVAIPRAAKNIRTVIDIQQLHGERGGKHHDALKLRQLLERVKSAANFLNSVKTMTTPLGRIAGFFVTAAIADLDILKIFQISFAGQQTI